MMSNLQPLGSTLESLFQLQNHSFDEQAYKQLTDKVIEKVEKFTHQGSGWSVYKLLEFRLKIAKHVPIKGSSYLELPEKYRNPKFRLINMKKSR